MKLKLVSTCTREWFFKGRRAVFNVYLGAVEILRQHFRLVRVLKGTGFLKGVHVTLAFAKKVDKVKKVLGKSKIWKKKWLGNKF